MIWQKTFQNELGKRSFVLNGFQQNLNIVEAHCIPVRIYFVWWKIYEVIFGDVFSAMFFIFGLGKPDLFDSVKKTFDT